MAAGHSLGWRPCLPGPGLGRVKGPSALLRQGLAVSPTPHGHRHPVLTTISLLSLRWEGLVLIILYAFYILIMK